jgi:stearoyl-CoA 9-desaturase NADPH oxidoreductase
MRDFVRTGLWQAASGLATPLVPADYIGVVAPLAAGSAPGRAPFRGVVEALGRPTPDATTLVIRTSRGWPGHRPGQYVRVGVDVDGVRLWRAYSITSGLDTGRRIKLTVKQIEGGKVSNYINRRVRPGTVLQLDNPTGDFVLPDPLPPRILFVTAGSGITPVIGILRNHLDRLDDVVFVHSSPTPAGFIYGREMRQLASEGRFRLVERSTDADGMLSPADLDRLVPDWAQRQTWACGPIGMLDDLQSHWDAHGVDDRLHTERFRPAFVAIGDGGTVEFSKSGQSAQASGAIPLLDVGEAAGVLMPSGCRMGICYGCVSTLAAGTVRDLRTGALTTAEEGDAIAIQTCINAAASDCQIIL